MEYPKFKVCCRCFTFNHSKYITDAMNGFTMQQTSFPFVCCIADDASTDGEQDVIREYVEDNFDFSEGSVAYHKETDYAHITYAQHKTNKNCYFAVLYLKENHYSQRKSKMGYLSEWRDMCEYEALCEGDDYWTDNCKLWEQVNYMESHPDYGMCYGQVLFFYNSTNKLSKRPWGGDYVSFESFMEKSTVPTLTAMYRISLEKRYHKEIQPIIKSWKMGDYPKWIWFSHESEIHFNPTTYGVYRILEETASHSESFEKTEAFIKSGLEIRKFFASYFNRLDLYDENMCYYNLLSEAFKYKDKSKVKQYYNLLRSKSMKAFYKYLRSMFF